MQNIYRPEGMLLGSPENRIFIHSPEKLREAMRSRLILEAAALSADTELNLTVDLGAGARGVIPREECVLLSRGERFKEISVISRVGKAVSFCVLREEKTQDGLPLFWLSRREAQLLCRENYVSRLEAGDVIDARVTHLEQYGAFCDVGCGLFALLPVDSVSVSRIPHPSERLSPGDCIRAAVRSRDENCRVFLTRRELCGTWEENAALFSVGETVTGVVRSVESYGVFIELTPNLAGLAEPSDGLVPGQRVSVYIKSILPEKMKVKLVIIDSCPAVVSRSPEPVFPICDVQHLDRWVYSPAVCPRKVVTVFGD